MSETRYSYLWEFIVPPERKAEFERHCGPEGPWVTLFRKAPGYIETLLLHDRQVAGRYLTLDRWQSKDAYRAFTVRFADEYAALDRAGEGFSSNETFLGEFSE